ncbi:MAG: YlxR family protein [Desulfomonilaceae bacterium]
MMVNRGYIPQRTCISCRKKMPADQLMQFKLIDGKLSMVSKGIFAKGRGCYVCPSNSCLNKAIKKNLFSRALKSPVSAVDVEIDFSKEG